MKNIKRIICSVLVIAMLLTGCTIKTTPEIAATYGDGQELTTGEYLAYLYLEFENLYFNQGLYQYAAYGMDPWGQSFPYGDDGEQLALSDYIIRATQDNIKRQIVLTQLLKDKGIQWFEEDEKELDESIASMEADAYLPLGFNNDSYIYALKNANLNERAAFYGQYGEGGLEPVAEKEIKEYFKENYLSYKMISISLTDENGKELGKDSEQRKKIMERLDGYLDIYEDKGFAAAKEAYNKDEKTNTESTTTEEDHEGHDHEEEEVVDEDRVDVDATTLDDDTAKAIRSVKVGKAKVVEFGTTAALIVRMDINKNTEGKKDDTLYKDSVEDIIYELKYEDFNKVVEEKVAELGIVFNEKVTKKCDPKDFEEIISNL